MRSGSATLLLAFVTGLILAGVVGPVGQGLVAFLVLPLLVTLLASELDREGGRIAVRIVDLASLLLPRGSRADHRDEWVDHVLKSGEVGIRPGLSALLIAFVAAPRLALTERLGLPRGFGFLEQLVAAIRQVVNVKPFPPVSRLEYLSRVDLLRVPDEELMEILHAIQVARRRGKPVPISLIYEFASIPMSHRLHSLRGCRLRRRPLHVRCVSRIKFYVQLLRFGIASGADTQVER